MKNHTGLSIRRAGFARAIEHLREAGPGGLITTELADKLCASDTTAKSYMRTMLASKIITIKKVACRVGSPANCALLIADQAQIDAFLLSDKISKKKAAPPKRRRMTVKLLHSECVNNYQMADLPSGGKARMYTDLPLSFFRPSLAEVQA